MNDNNLHITVVVLMRGWRVQAHFLDGMPVIGLQTPGRFP
jgi:hypothetical protein